MEISLIEVWGQMTLAARVVAVCLGIMSVIMVAVAIERFIAYLLARSQSKQFAALITKGLKERQIDDVNTIANKKEYKRSYLARIVSAGIVDFKDLQETKGNTEDLSTVRSAMSRTVEQETLTLRRWLSVLATIGATAPFVGLLGTVLGIIGTFQKMALEGLGIETVGVNIAEALIETAFGLFVAIPAVWLYNYFNGRVEDFIVEMNNNSSEMLDYFFKNRGHLDGSSR
jgi:biopolymer transport protein ExbB/biopolymer transport protein TolQ